MFLNLNDVNWKPRKEQLAMVDSFKELLDSDKKFLTIEAPTGVGKSFAIMLMIKEYLRQNDGGRFDLLTNLRALQSQYLRDFGYLNSFKGKDNYTCQNYGTNCADGGVINKLSKKRCNDCPFQMAKTKYQEGTVGLLNFALYINYLLYQPDFLKERKANILFIDEAYLFEEIYCDFIESHMSLEYFNEIGIILHPEDAVEFNKITDKQSYYEFLTSVVLVRCHVRLNKLKFKMEDIGTSQEMKIVVAKDYNYLYRVVCKYNRFVSRHETDNWLLQHDIVEGQNVFSIKSIWGTPFMKEIWQMYDKVVLLSGTILDINFFNDLMDINKEESMYLEIDSPFPVKNRKIFFLDKGKMSFDHIEKSYKALLPTLKDIMSNFPTDKGIIHSGSYKLSNWIMKDIISKRLLTHNSSNKENVLYNHTVSKEPTILVSPVMVNGVDLKDDLSRFQVIMKIPFPSLDSEKVKMRMKQNKTWYYWKTLCAVVQSYGRSVRSEEDYAETFILDSSFNHLIKMIKLPKYFKNALITGHKSIK